MVDVGATGPDVAWPVFAFAKCSKLLPPPRHAYLLPPPPPPKTSLHFTSHPFPSSPFSLQFSRLPCFFSPSLPPLFLSASLSLFPSVSPSCSRDPLTPLPLPLPLPRPLRPSLPAASLGFALTGPFLPSSLSLFSLVSSTAARRASLLLCRRW